ncbi:MAG: penicillin-binding protein family [Acidimicrobiales bacterium]|jgi:penicillin-binding protein 1A|nr:penicillin-binding protein family [Acidimicrobiales bacterium]
MNRLRLAVKAVTVFLISTVLVPIAVVGTVISSFLFLPLPATLPEAKAGIESKISHVYAADGTEIALFREFETSIPVRPQDIPAVLKQAVVASEDRRFYSHGGVDVQGSLRALWADLQGKGVVQGGSTITQQYVKNAYLNEKRTITRKVREAILASQLDRKSAKDDILFRYLESIYLGGGAYGVEAASETYFGHPVSQLTLSEAALLAGVIPAPTRYAPRQNAALAETRRMIVLREMLDQKRITQQQFEEAAAQQVFVITQFGPRKGATNIVPPVTVQQRYPYFIDYLRKYLERRYGHETVYRGGLRIYTTLDPKMQAAAEFTITNTLSGTKPPLEMALVAVEPATGYVKAMVGGRDFYDKAYGQTNLALGACPGPPIEGDHATPPFCIAGGGTGRQPGSSFKPFTLATAFEEGISPNKVYAGPFQYTYPKCPPIQKGCTVRNTEEAENFGAIPLRQATWHSVNTVFAQLVQDVGVQRTAEMANRLGETMIDPKKQHFPGITLGTEEVSPLDHAASYAVFANRGVRAAPVPVLRITDGTGKVLEDNTKLDDPARVKRVISETVADNVTDVLRGVITSGTAKGSDIGRPAAGKTGTSENNQDAWFAGFTPALSTAVWMGYADTPRPLLGIKGVARVYGGTIPARAWHDFMLFALKDVPPTDFNQPAPIQATALDTAHQLRGGIDPGDRRGIIGIGPGGVYQYNPPPPVAEAPTTTSPPTTAPETTTTKPGGLAPP